MRIVIQHRNRYAYPRPALLGPQVIRLRPTDHARADGLRFCARWPLRARPVPSHPEQPYTLDLRRIDAGTPMPDPQDRIQS